MSRRYDFAMQRHGKGQRRKRKSKLQDFEGFQGASLFKDQVATDTDTNRKWDTTGTQSPEESLIDDSLDYFGDPRDIPLTVHAVGIGQQTNATQIGQEFSGITDRISKLLQDYESMYDDADHQGYAAMQEHLSGQMAMENLLSDYTSLCRDREELLNSLQDSLDVDEDEVLEELEKMDLKRHQIDMDAAQRAVHDTFQNVRDTSERLKAMNKKMVMSKQGEAIENLEVEKRQLERELQMYKKMAVQQRKDIFARRASTVRKEETQQWKMVSSEMVDILKMVRHEGNLDKESLEKELNRILMTLSTQNEHIENLKRDLSKSEKSVKNLEKEKNTLNDEKLVVQSQLSNKQNELKQCKQYLRKVMAEKKDPSEKIKFEGGEIDLKEDEVKFVTLDDNKPNVDILQAQIRDSKRLLFIAEEENRDLKRKLASITEKKELGKEPPPTEAERKEHVQAAQAAQATPAAPKQCLQCASYKAQLVNKTEELKEANAYIARLKDQLNNLRAQLKTTQKETTLVKSQVALVEAGATEGEQDRPGSSASSPAESEAGASCESHSESREDEVKEEPRQSLTVPSQKPKQQPGKPKASPRQAKTLRKKKEEMTEVKEVKEVKEEHSFEEEDNKTELSASKEKKKQQPQSRGVNLKPRDLVIGECREEKAPYVTVREARMVTLSEKGTQTTHYDRKASEGITQRDSVGPRHSIQHRRRSIADAIMACVPPNVVEHETSTALMFIKEEADRLCDEISSFVEFGFDFVQQGAKSNRIQSDVHLGEDNTRELLDLRGADSTDQTRSLKSILSNEYRRQSLSSHKKRRGTIQLERRGTIHRKDSTKLPLIETNETGRTRQDSIIEQPEADCDDETAPSTEQPPPVLVNTLFPQQQETDDKSEAPPPLPQMADTVRKIMDTTFVKKSKWRTLKHLFRSLQPHKGGGCSHVLGEIKTIAEESEALSAEDQVKEQVTVMAQHVIDTLQSTAQVMSYQMEEELNFYEKFYERWDGVRQAKRAVTREFEKKEEVPVVGKQVLLTERGPDQTHVEDSMMSVPHINSQISNYKSKQGQAIATAGLASSGMLMIQGSGSSSGEGIPHSTSQSKVKKRAKAQSWSRKQLLIKQKAYMENVLHVDAKLEDLNRIFSGMEETQSLPPRYGQRIPATLSQDYSLPLIAQSLALPPLSKGLHVNKGKSALNLREVDPRGMNADLNVEPAGDNTSKDIMRLPGMNTNTTWNRNQSIAQFPSQSTMKKNKEKNTKLPLLTMNHLLKVAV